MPKCSSDSFFLTEETRLVIDACTTFLFRAVKFPFCHSWIAQQWRVFDLTSATSYILPCLLLPLLSPDLFLSGRHPLDVGHTSTTTSVLRRSPVLHAATHRGGTRHYDR